MARVLHDETTVWRVRSVAPRQQRGLYYIIDYIRGVGGTLTSPVPGKYSPNLWNDTVMTLVYMVVVRIWYVYVVWCMREKRLNDSISGPTLAIDDDFTGWLSRRLLPHHRRGGCQCRCKALAGDVYRNHTRMESVAVDRLEMFEQCPTITTTPHKHTP